MDEDQLGMSRRQIHVLLEHCHFVAAVLVQPDFADAEHSWTFQKLRDKGQYVVGQFEVFRFLGVDAKPAEMRQPELRRALGLMLGQLTEVVVKSVSGTAVEAGPEGRFA